MVISHTFQLSLSEILVSCADDQSVRVWSPVTHNHASDSTHTGQCDWNLLRIFRSGAHIAHWHTITYLAIDAARARVMCATQNGHVLIWQVNDAGGKGAMVTTDDESLLYAGKLHTASIEGLVFEPRTRLLASVSSDCCVNVFRIV